MHSEAEIRRAAKNAGCRLLELRRVETPVGPAYVGRYDCPTNEHTFRLLLEFAAIDLGDPIARSVGLEVRSKLGPDPRRMACAIHEWVKRRVWYAREPSETFQAPWYTLSTGVGDCDDHANLVHAIARNAGLPARILPVRDKDGIIRHACAQIGVAGLYCWAETTLDAAFDEAPKAAALRLRASERTDVLG